jgi:hypothetical protein
MKQPKPLTPAQQAEEDRAIIRQAMAIIGSRSTHKKARAVRKNGKLGGRPRKLKTGKEQKT